MTIKYLRPRDVANRYSVARSTVYRWLRDDPTFPRPRRFGYVTLWDIAELEQWESQRRLLA